MRDLGPGGSARLDALDGLRAVAVLAVLAFHGGVTAAAGGMFGVDLFFVLSGFLITGLLLREHAGRGRIALSRFWGRRARRLLPALVVTVAAALALARWAGGASLGQVRGDAVATLLYASNWHQILAGQNYFQRNGAPSPLLHTWSLGIEEQFYLFWPLVVVVVLRRRGAAAVTKVAAAGALASAGAMAVMASAGVGTNRLYDGTDTRAQALLVGAALAGLLASSVGRSGPDRSRPAPGSIRGAGWAGAAVLLWMIHAVPGTDRWLYHGGFLLVALGGAAVVASAVLEPAGRLARILATGPLVLTGRISYGLYLYHYPLFLWIDGARTGLHGLPLFVVRVAVTFAVAAVSFVVLEEPIRTGTWRSARQQLWLKPLSRTVGVLAALTGILAVSLPQSAAGASDASLSVSATPLPSVAGRAPVRAVVVGDSMGVTLYEGLSVDAGHWGVRLDDGAALGCDLDPTSTVEVMGVVSRASQGCPDWRTAWARLVATDDPQVVVVMLGRWETVSHVYQGRWTYTGQQPWDDHLKAELEQAVDILSSRGAKVELMTLPYVQQTTEAPDGQPWDMNRPARTDAFNSILRSAAASRPGRAVVVDLNRIVDPAGRYASYVDGIRVRNRDDEHFSIAGGEWLRPILLPTIEKLGPSPAAARRPGGPAASESANLRGLGIEIAT